MFTFSWDIDYIGTYTDLVILHYLQIPYHLTLPTIKTITYHNITLLSCGGSGRMLISAICRKTASQSRIRPCDNSQRGEHLSHLYEK